MGSQKGKMSFAILRVWNSVLKKKKKSLSESDNCSDIRPYLEL